MGTAFVLIILFAIILSIILSMIKSRKNAEKKGVSGCGCHCSGCSGKCHS